MTSPGSPPTEKHANAGAPGESVEARKDSEAPKASAAEWTAHRERSNAWTLRLMAWIAVTLGRPVARLILHPISLYFLLTGGAAARASRDYLQRVRGRAPSWGERYAHIHHFAATILDRVYLLRDELADFDIRITGAEHLDAVLARGQGALLIGAHLGSFEALRALGQSRRGLEVAMVMYEENARLINRTLRALAPEAALRIIALGRLEAMLELRDWLDHGGVAGVLGDRRLPTQSQRSVLHRLPLLGEEAVFSDAALRLAALLRRPVLFMAGLYHGGSTYELRFVPVADFSDLAPGRAGRGSAKGAGEVEARIAAALQAFVGQVEAVCRETPYNWFNFFDFWADAQALDAPPPPNGTTTHG